MQKQRSAYNYSSKLEKSTLGTQKATVCQPKKAKTRLIKNIGMGTKTKLRPTIPLLLTQIRFRLRSLRNVMKALKETIQPLGSIPLRLPRKIMIRLRT